MIKRRKSRTSKVIIGALLIFLLLFTGVCLYLFFTTGNEPSTLIGAVFVFCGGECGILGWIKTTKERQTERDYELKDRKYQEKLMKVQKQIQNIVEED